MSLFRINPDNPFNGPHQGQQVVTGGPVPSKARAAMIMIHGRGATAQSMLRFANEFSQPDFHYAALQAKNHTWYPHSFLAPQEQNQPGLNSGLQAIHDQIQTLKSEGIPNYKIILLGFSQGACLTSEFAARHPQKWGGVVALSGGLIGASVDAANYTGSMDQTPVFLGCSDIDPHIPKERVDETEKIFKKLSADVTKRIYKGMGHTINDDEIKIIRSMMTSVLE